MKIPLKMAQRLAELHNLVMELQDEFDSFKTSCYDRDFSDDEQEMIGDLDIDELEEEIYYICEKLDDIESETSELDCEYNDYGY